MMGINIITSLIVIITCISLLSLLLILTTGYFNKNILVKITLYVILIAGIYFLIIMFKQTSGIIKDDVINTIENTERYNGFINPITVVSVGLIGTVLGSCWYKFNSYIKNYNMRNKKR